MLAAEDLRLPDLIDSAWRLCTARRRRFGGLQNLLQLGPALRCDAFDPFRLDVMKPDADSSNERLADSGGFVRGGNPCIA